MVLVVALYIKFAYTNELILV